MSNISQNYNVYVSALRFRTVRNNKTPSSNSEFTIRVKVMTSYISDATVGNMRRGLDTWESFINPAQSMTIRKLEDSSSEKLFLFSRHNLTWDSVSKLISDMNIPFSLDHLQWRGNPKVDWIPLPNEDDIISSILNVAGCKKSKDAADTSSTSVATTDGNNLTLSVSIKREIILAHEEFEATVTERRAQELVQQIHEGISWMNRQLTGSDSDNLLVENWVSMIVQASKDEMGADFEHNSSLRSLIELSKH